MNPLILALTMILPIVAFAVGVTLARRNTGGLSRSDRRELEAKRGLFHDLDLKASEHMAYGDTFATIVSGMLHDHRKQITKGNQ